MKNFFNTGTTRNLVVAFLDIFNDMKVERIDDNGNRVKLIDIPLTFGHPEKYQYPRQDINSGKKYYVQLPRMGLTLDSIDYNAERATAVNDIRYLFDPQKDLDSITKIVTNVQPVPYDFSFTLYIKTESMNDFSQIMDNILPYFNPALYLRVKEFTFLNFNLERDIQVLLNGGVNPDFLIDQAEEDKRFVNGTINFLVQAFMYRPTDEQEIIKTIQTRYYVNNNVGTSATDFLTETYSTSGTKDISAAPDDYDYSGTFTGRDKETSASINFFTSADNFS